MSGRPRNRPSLARRLKRRVGAIPIVGDAARLGFRVVRGMRYGWEGSSRNYWEARYHSGGDSGDGSYGKLSEFKAEVLNAFVTEFEIATVIEFGCGDGNQLGLAEYPSYWGYDVSQTAVSRCKRRFAKDSTKTFALVSGYQDERADLVLSLDVLYHLVEDEVFLDYLDRLFGASNRFVCVYSSDFDDDLGGNGHIRHRQFSSVVEERYPAWETLRVVPNRYPASREIGGSPADFFFYKRKLEARS